MGKTWVKLLIWVVGALMILLLIFQCSNIFGYYTLPIFPGLRRLGPSIFNLFISAEKVAWVDESTVIYLSPEFRRGLPAYSLRLNQQIPKRVFIDFYLHDFSSAFANNQVAFIDRNQRKNKLWISNLFDNPRPVAYAIDESQDLMYLDWFKDGESLIVNYFDPMNDSIDYIGEVDVSNHKLTKLYTMKIGDDPTDGIDVSDDRRVVYVTRKNYGKISILNLELEQVEVLDFGPLVFSRIDFLRKQPWLIGLVAGEDGDFSNKIALINREEKCMVTPFDSLTGIRDFDVYETDDNLKLILVDEHRLLYILDFSQALGENLLSSMLSCNQ